MCWNCEFFMLHPKYGQLTWMPELNFESLDGARSSLLRLQICSAVAAPLDDLMMEPHLNETNRQVPVDFFVMADFDWGISVLAGSLLLVSAALCVQSWNLTAVIWLTPDNPPPTLPAAAIAEFADKADFYQHQVTTWPLHFKKVIDRLFVAFSVNSNKTVSFLTSLKHAMPTT